MTFRLFRPYATVFAPWASPALADNPGQDTVQPPALPVPDANATRMTDIHDIKPPLNPGIDLHWLYWTLAIIAALLIAVLAWRLWQKRRTPVAEPAAPPIPPETEAFRMLDALAADDTMSPRQFYFDLSAVLRRYIERRYDIPAAEMTTEELLPMVDRLSLAGTLTQPFKFFCRRADPIKFAGADAAREHMVRDLAFAREFVATTTAEAADKEAAENEPPEEPTTEPVVKQLPLNGGGK